MAVDERIIANALIEQNLIWKRALARSRSLRIMVSENATLREPGERRTC
jgi:hypothetical protein